MISACEKNKFVYILNRENERVTVSSPLEAPKSHTIIFDIIGLDAGYTIGQPTREGEHYRSKNDIVSLLGSGATNMKTLDKNTNILNAHDVDNVKESKIFI